MQKDMYKYSWDFLDPRGQHPFCSSKKKDKIFVKQEEDLQDWMSLFVAGRGLNYSSKKWVMVSSLHLKKPGYYYYSHVLWEKGGAPEEGEQIW